MKILVSYATHPKIGNFEGVRLRKSIKGSLELNNIPWVESLLFEPEIAHFISFEDEAKVKEAKANGVFTIVHALYCENDPTTRYTTSTSNGPKLKAKALKMLEAADLVLVPTEQGKQFLLDSGCPTEIKVWSPAINMSRFENNDTLENKIVYQYLKIQNNQKYSISIGNFDDENAIKSIKAIASRTPDMKFYFILSPINSFGQRRPLFRLQHKKPANLSFIDPLPDDVYRSAMVNAFSVIILGDAFLNDTIALEAFASRDRVFVLGKGDEIVVNGKNAICCPDPISLSESLSKEAQKDIPETIIDGYKIAKANSLRLAGFELTKIYKEILARRTNND